MQAILTEEEYKEYLGLKASKAVSLEALQMELSRRVTERCRSLPWADVSNLLHGVFQVIKDLPNIAKELAEKK